MTTIEAIPATAMAAVAITTPISEDVPAIHSLLQHSAVPLAGFDQHLGSTLIAWTESAGVIGNVTLELYGSDALLRSVAVAPVWRGGGLGQRLVRAALDLAPRWGVRRVYLLTETAAGFFLKLGFYPVPREVVPAPLLQSVEFTRLCPVGSLVMALDLDATSPAESCARAG